MKKEKLKYVIGFLVIVSFVFLLGNSHDSPLSASNAGSDVHQILQKMPKRDRKKLEYFFRESISWESFGYVLHGKKPMAFGGIDGAPLFKSWDSFLYAISPRRIQYMNGYKSWKKYEHLFPSRRFIFLYEKIASGMTVFLIDKENFDQTVKKYSEDFKSILHREVTGETLLREAKSRSLFEVLGNDDRLIGILLGYGRGNAYLFHLRSQIQSREERTKFNEENHFGDPWQQEWEQLDKKMDAYGWISANITGEHIKDLDLINYPGFCARIDSTETLDLKKIYDETRKKMIESFKGQDFLETVLHILIH